jgi:glucuronate isomerase
LAYNAYPRAYPARPRPPAGGGRVDCAFLARLVAEHRLREDEAHELARELAYTLAKKAYRL